MYDVIIIGGGVVGCAAAYLLSRYQLKTVLLEADNDVANGTTKANSAILHAGYDPECGSLMAKYNVKGSQMAKEICARLDVPYKQIGALVVALNPDQAAIVDQLYQRGVANGVADLQILDEKQLHEMEPNVNPEAVRALYAPTSAIVSPWEYALAMAQTAIGNGVEVLTNNKVTAISKKDDVFSVTTVSGRYEGRFIINAAGTHADKVFELIGPKEFTIEPVAGEYYLLDKSEGSRVTHTIFQCPTATGKGVLVSPTVDGNLIVGPNATACGPDDTQTTLQGLAAVKKMAAASVPSIDFRENIKNFAGVRARCDRHDFIVEESRSVKHFINLAAIQSPGLSAAPAISQAAIDIMAADGLVLTEKEQYTDSRHVVRFKDLSEQQKNDLIKKDPRYGRVICRCETITEGEIVAAIHSPLPPVSIDGIKRRTTAGMGRCQGGFCGPRVLAILARETGAEYTDILQDHAGSNVLVAPLKEGE